MIPNDRCVAFYPEMYSVSKSGEEILPIWHEEPRLSDVAEEIRCLDTRVILSATE